MTYPASMGRAQPGMCCASSEASQSTRELIASDGKRLREGEEVHHHGKSENRLLHRSRDVTLGEDACQTRMGAVPGILARLNRNVLSLMDRLGVRNVARQARSFDAHLEQALGLLLDFALFAVFAWESPASGRRLVEFHGRNCYNDVDDRSPRGRCV